MNKQILEFSMAAALLFTACNQATQKSNMASRSFTADNPFAIESNLPYYTFNFDSIRNTDFAPAFDEGMKRQLEEIADIADNEEAPTFENTLLPMEKSGQLLGRARAVFNLLTGASTNDELQGLDEVYAPKFAAHQDAIYLNGTLFKRIIQISEQVEQLALDAESKHLVAYYYQKFVMAGAGLADPDKERLKKLNEEEASLSAAFSRKLLAAGKAGELVLSDKDALDGLSAAELDAAASAAKTNGQAGKWQISLQNTTQQPLLTSLKNRSTRQELFEASWNRTSMGDDHDTRAIISRIAQLRAQKAKLLGFPTYAAWKLQDQSAKTPEAVFEFLNQLIPATVKKGHEEAAAIQHVIRFQKDTFALKPWDWDFYAEQVRKETYDLDESQIKPYFVLDSVLENGVFYAANQLYGITFKERKDIPRYQEDVRVFEVFDKDGSSLALFYSDNYKRDNKRGGAWMSNLVRQSDLLDRKPVIYNVCNFSKPAEGRPALISFDDVTTLFHEFGHALHGMFASQKYPSLSGTATPRDFVEFPSQFNEHWALYPAILKNYAKHYQTGETMPQVIIDKVKKAGTFNQGYAFGEYLAAAALDMEWHTLTADAPLQQADSVENRVFKKLNMPVSFIPPRYRSTYFSHIWGSGYAAGYYAYSWAEMLDDDAYAWFEENGGLLLKNGQYFRDKILSRGNTDDFSTLYRNFRGKDPVIGPLLLNRGLLK